MSKTQQPDQHERNKTSRRGRSRSREGNFLKSLKSNTRRYKRQKETTRDASADSTGETNRETILSRDESPHDQEQRQQQRQRLDQQDEESLQQTATNSFKPIANAAATTGRHQTDHNSKPKKNKKRPSTPVCDMSSLKTKCSSLESKLASLQKELVSKDKKIQILQQDKRAKDASILALTEENESKDETIQQQLESLKLRAQQQRTDNQLLTEERDAKEAWKQKYVQTERERDEWKQKHARSEEERQRLVQENFQLVQKRRLLDELLGVSRRIQQQSEEMEMETALSDNVTASSTNAIADTHFHNKSEGEQQCQAPSDSAQDRLLSRTTSFQSVQNYEPQQSEPSNNSEQQQQAVQAATITKQSPSENHLLVNGGASSQASTNRSSPRRGCNLDDAFFSQVKDVTTSIAKAAAGMNQEMSSGANCSFATESDQIAGDGEITNNAANANGESINTKEPPNRREAPSDTQKSDVEEDEMQVDRGLTPENKKDLHTTNWQDQEEADDVLMKDATTEGDETKEDLKRNTKSRASSIDPRRVEPTDEKNTNVCRLVSISEPIPGAHEDDPKKVDRMVGDPIEGKENAVGSTPETSHQMVSCNTTAKRRASVDESASSMSLASSPSSNHQEEKKDDLWSDNEDGVLTTSKNATKKSRKPNKKSNTDGWIDAKAIKPFEKTQTSLRSFFEETPKGTKSAKGKIPKSTTAREPESKDLFGFERDESTIKRRRYPSPSQKAAADIRSQKMIQRKKRRKIFINENGEDFDTNVATNDATANDNNSLCKMMDEDPTPMDVSTNLLSTTASDIASSSRLQDSRPNRVSLSTSKSKSSSSSSIDGMESPNLIQVDEANDKSYHSSDQEHTPKRNKEGSILDRNCESEDDVIQKDALEGNKHNEQKSEASFELKLPTDTDVVDKGDTQGNETQWQVPLTQLTKKDSLIAQNTNAGKARWASQSMQHYSTAIAKPPSDAVAFKSDTQESETQWDASLQRLHSATASKPKIKEVQIPDDTQGSETQWKLTPIQRSLDPVVSVSTKPAMKPTAANLDTQGSETQWEPSSLHLLKGVQQATKSNGGLGTLGTPREETQSQPTRKESIGQDTQGSETQWPPTVSVEKRLGTLEEKENIPNKANAPSTTGAYFAEIQRTVKPKVTKKIRNGTGWISNKPARAFLDELDAAIPRKPDKNWLSRKKQPKLVTRSSKTADEVLSDDEWMGRYDDSDPGYAYVESRKGKCRHRKAGEHCADCPECTAFYQALQNQGLDIDPETFAKENALKNSRHRGRYLRSDTPDDFWEMSFIDEKKKREEEALQALAEEEKEQDLKALAKQEEEVITQGLSEQEEKETRNVITKGEKEQELTNYKEENQEEEEEGPVPKEIDEAFIEDRTETQV